MKDDLTKENSFIKCLEEEKRLSYINAAKARLFDEVFDELRGAKNRLDLHKLRTMNLRDFIVRIKKELEEAGK